MTRVRLLFIMLVVASLTFAQAPAPQGQVGPDQQAGQQQLPDDEPGRPVARLSLMNGDASVRRGDSGTWVAATVNAPLMVQDSVSVGPGGYAEVQFDNANIVRIAGDSEARISTLDNGRFGVQVMKGMVTYRVLRQTNAQSEVATPQVAVRPAANSAVRVEVLADGYSRIIVRTGEADVFTPKGVEKVRAGGMMMIRGEASDPEYQVTAASVPDDWDRFNEKRDQDLLSSRSNQYVSHDMYGAEDLDRGGQWTNDPQYGNVWAPTVAADWAPYRDGRWVWEDYYGWTWVGNEPWGWAPYHYGSWYYRGGGFGWCWFPGRAYERAFWRPALVGFFGFGGWRGGIGVGVGFGGGIGWVPLAPFERFHPWYGRGYGGGYGQGWYGGRNVVGNVNIVNNTNITNVYRNVRVTNGVSGLGAREFSGGQFNSIHSLGGQNLQSANLVRGALPMQPSQAHLAFTNRAASGNVPHVNSGSTQRFAPTRMGGVQASRTPFAQQQSSFANVNRSAPTARPSTQSNPASSGWQRFGSTQQGSAQGNSTSPNSMSQGWQRFGTPQSNGAARTTAPSQNWNSFGRPGATQSAPQRSAGPSGASPGGTSPNGTAQRNFYQAPSTPRYSSPQNGGRPLQIAPPMVQQRAPQDRSSQQRSAPSYTRPSGGSNSGSHSSGGSGGGGGSHSGGGGGSHSSGHGRR